MIMNKIKIAAVILLLVTFASCSKNDLDISNPNTVTTANFWKTASDAQMGVNAIYSTFHRQGICRWMQFMTIIRSDEGYSTSPAPWIVNMYDVFNTTNYNDYLVTCVWQDAYIGINRANQVLDNVPNITMDASKKQQYLAEAKFMRGWFYYTLAIIYGNVPIQLHTSKPADLPLTSTQDEVFAQAENDFTDAAADLPTSYGSADLGRVTKGAAYGMLGKCYLQQHNYSEAKNALQWLTEGAGTSIYSLMSDYRSNFIETSENNAESVFEFQFAVNPNDWFDDDQGVSGITSDHLNYGSSLPPFFAPRPIGFTDGQARRWVVWEFLKEKTTTNGRDPRLAVTFLYDSTDERGPDYTMVYGRTFSSMGYSSDPTAVPNTQFVYLRKYLDDATMTGEVFHSGNNYRYLRYSDILLLYAEALNGMGQTSAAYPFVDEVRQRAGLAKLSTIMPSLTQAQFLEQLKHERLTELAGEGHRWEDLARWGELSNALASRDAGFSHFVKNRDEFYPIPQSEIDLNPNLKQNPGW